MNNGYQKPAQEDLRRARPYFLVPLGDAGLPGISKSVRDDIVKYRNALKAEATNTAENQVFTDIYVFSHGWHRNLLSGVAAYDRLITRFSLLMNRGRLSQTPSVSPPVPFNPLFIAFHWNSDPGDDRWTDKSGRRHKDSFIKNCQDGFMVHPQSEATFLTDFEDLFEFMSQISASSLDAMDLKLDPLASNLTDALKKYEIRYCPKEAPMTLDQKVSFVWKCYFESQNQAFLTDQQQKAKPVGDPGNAVGALVKFLIGLLGIMVFLGFLPLPKIWSFLEGRWDSFLHVVTGSEAQNVGPLPRLVLGSGLYIGAIVVLAFLLWLLWWGQFYRHDNEKRGQGTSIIALLPWLPLQIMTTLPVLVGLATTFIFRTGLVWVFFIAAYLLEMPLIAWAGAGVGLLWSLVMSLAGRPVPGLFDEKADSRKELLFPWRDWMAKLARLPIRWLRDLMSEESPIMRAAEAMDAQFAFFEMQRKGCTVGKEAGLFLRDLVNDLGINKSEDTVDIHLIGHSFGGLVVANAAREFARGFDEKKTSAKLKSVCLVQAAMASNWFQNEEKLLGAITGAVSCVYSQYDTANGFYYPVANNGRLAAGYVGLCNVCVESAQLGKGGAFAMLVAPPPLPDMMPKPCSVVNLDASRLIYEGAIATGGGHSDIFKDDIVNLIWSATRLR